MNPMRIQRIIELTYSRYTLTFFLCLAMWANSACSKGMSVSVDSCDGQASNCVDLQIEDATPSIGHINSLAIAAGTPVTKTYQVMGVNSLPAGVSLVLPEGVTEVTLVVTAFNSSSTAVGIFRTQAKIGTTVAIPLATPSCSGNCGPSMACTQNSDCSSDLCDPVQLTCSLKAAKLAFGVQPTDASLNVRISPAVTVLVQDANGNLLMNSSSSVTMALLNADSATLSGTLTQAAVNGVATFDDLSINAIATGYSLMATSSGLTAATSAQFNIEVLPPTITMQPASTTAALGGTAVFTVVATPGTGTTSYVWFKGMNGAGTAVGSNSPTLTFGSVQASDQGSYFVAVSSAVGNSGSTVVSNDATLTLAASITSINPSTAAIGTSITISGLGFSQVLSDNTVTFGSTDATPTSASSSSLTVTVPIVVGGPTMVSVTSPGFATSSGYALTVLDLDWTNWPLPADPPTAYVAGSGTTSGTVRDTVTGLVWQQPVSNAPSTWAVAQTYCAELSLGGFTEGQWRLPTVIELLSLVDDTQSNPALNSILASNTATQAFWSSSPTVGNSGVAWGVNFAAGSSYVADTGNNNFVRCVH